jgi:hypothetical protein
VPTDDHHVVLGRSQVGRAWPRGIPGPHGCVDADLRGTGTHEAVQSALGVGAVGSVAIRTAGPPRMTDRYLCLGRRSVAADATTSASLVVAHHTT